MNTHYYMKSSYNPNFGFNKLSIGNPFNFYGYENSKNSYLKTNYSTFTHKTPRVKMYNDIILEENKVGLKTNPKQPPMTNTYNLNTNVVKTEQKYNPYFAAYNYPQWMDKVKDLMNYTYNEEKATIYYNTSKINSNDYANGYGAYSQNNLRRVNNVTNAPPSSRVPRIDNNIYTSLINKNYHYITNNKNNLNQKSGVGNINNINLQNSQNYINNVNYSNKNPTFQNKPVYTTISNNYYPVQNNSINNNPVNNINQNNSLQLSNQNINYTQNITQSAQIPNVIPYTNNEITSDNNSTEYYKESKGGLVKSYAYCEEPNLNHRQYMEDQGIAIENFNNDPNKILFGLFDGHGGGQVSKFLQENFATYMKQMMPFNDYFQNFINLFKILDEKVKALNCPDAGSTATIVYIERQNNKKYLYCINVGDSRCIIINKKGIMRLSKDDRVDDPNEKERIIKEGGFIYNGRIHGILMLSRCFGDWGIKNYGVSCQPHIAKIELNDDDLCLVIASDGVWDSMKDEEFKVLMNTKMNSLDICKDIITESLNKGSSDNISCFVINFK